MYILSGHLFIISSVLSPIFISCLCLVLTSILIHFFCSLALYTYILIFPDSRECILGFFCVSWMYELVLQHLLTDDVPLCNSLDKIMIDLQRYFYKRLKHSPKCKLSWTLISPIDKAITSGEVRYCKSFKSLLANIKLWLDVCFY